MDAERLRTTRLAICAWSLTGPWCERVTTARPVSARLVSPKKFSCWDTYGPPRHAAGHTGLMTAEPDPYLGPLTKSLHLELDAEESGFNALAREFPGVELSSKYIEVPSGPGVTQFKAVWRGATMTAWSLVDLHRQLREAQMMLGTPEEPEGP